MTRTKNDVPSPQTIECSLFGPGVGECCVLHLGGGEWFIVDSCTGLDGRPVALTYLEELGIDVAEAVSGVLVTHHHDDHIGGVSELLEAAESAKFYCPAAFNSDELLQLVRLQRNASSKSTNGTDELDRVFEILNQRKPKHHRRISVGPELVKANELVLHKQLGGVPISLKALSPSSEDIHRARQDFAQQFPEFKDARRRAVTFSPNHASIVLRLTVGERAVLLGADREVTKNQRTGWSVILDDEVGPRKAAFAYKVPHHGSENGDREEIWEELLTPHPICMVTPYRPSGLPRKADIQRLKQRTDALFMTAPRGGPKPARGDRTVDKMMRQFTRDRRQLRSEPGQIRLRFEADDEDSKLAVNLKGTACAC